MREICLMKIKSIIAITLMFAVLFSLCACRKLDNSVEIDGEGETYSDSNSLADTSEDVSTTLSEEMQEFVNSITDPAKEDEYFEKNDAVLGIADEAIDTEDMTEVTVKTDSDGNPVHGDQKTFFNKLADAEQYTIKMTLKSISTDGESTTVNITMMKNGSDAYIETKLPVSNGSALPMTILLKDKKCTIYMTSLKAYMEVPQDTYTSIVDEMELATSQESTATYVESGEVDVNGTTYDVDVYEDDGSTIKYYYLNDEIKRVEAIDSDGNISIIEYTQITMTADASKFTAPTGYLNMTNIMNSDAVSSLF
jgi:hypothetical protein